ncbi:hypothetical protein AJ79_08050 [Helicocarpus griseus UAMH5409]|uniref:CFEM domain-containing protein n=1 Tax=Helicocarpus griseus UAMH5409 TaxID=1447875 RepID=A0A2B7WW02_9EURO|nr:hypothetical protein AJ79_08050 [Helicocarpus griseus UAMH5409]
MKPTTLTLSSLFALLTTLNFAQGQADMVVPACARPCLEIGAKAVGCRVDDYKCGCPVETLKNMMVPCSYTNCGVAKTYNEVLPAVVVNCNTHGQ